MKVSPGLKWSLVCMKAFQASIHREKLSMVSLFVFSMVYVLVFEENLIWTLLLLSSLFFWSTDLGLSFSNSTYSPFSIKRRLWRDMGAGVKRLTDMAGFETSNVGDWLWWRWSFSRGEAEEEMELPDDEDLVGELERWRRLFVAAAERPLLRGERDLCLEDGDLLFPGLFVLLLSAELSALDLLDLDVRLAAAFFLAGGEGGGGGGGGACFLAAFTWLRTALISAAWSSCPADRSAIRSRSSLMRAPFASDASKAALA